MTENQQIRRRVTLTQLLHLWEFLKDHREIAVGYNKSTQARDHSKRMWERVAGILNSAGEGAIKSGPEWSKYWVDLKAKIKRKNRLINDSRRRTGGGPSTDLELSELDRKFLSILGDDYGSGLTGVQVDPQVPLTTQEQSNPGTSQSTASEEQIYVVINCSENENQQNEQESNIVSAPVAELPLPQSPVVPEDHGHQNLPQPQAAPPAPPSDRRQSLTGQGPRRRQRRRPYMTSADARERLVSASETRAQAELANSRLMENAVEIFREMMSILRRIENRFSAEAATNEQRDPAL